MARRPGFDVIPGNFNREPPEHNILIAQWNFWLSVVFLLCGFFGLIWSLGSYCPEATAGACHRSPHQLFATKLLLSISAASALLGLAGIIDFRFATTERWMRWSAAGKAIGAISIFVLIFVQAPA